MIRITFREWGWQSLHERRQMSLTQVKRGRAAGAEATHIWDRATTLRQTYAALMAQYTAMWRIGAANAKRGFKPARLVDLIRAYRDEVKLWAQDPPAE